MEHARIIGAIGICFFLAAGTAAFPQTPVDVIAPQTVALRLDGNTLKVPHFRNYALDKSHTNVTHAVVVIHGTRRDADKYYNYLAHYFSTSIHDWHKQAIVPGVGNSSTGMFASDCGKFFLFDFGSCSTITAVDETEDAVVQSGFALRQNYPNPFNPATLIAFDSPVPTEVYLTVYDILGRKIVSLLSGKIQHAGLHEVIWDGRNQRGEPVPSGVYVYVLRAGTFSATKKMLLVR